MNQRFKLLAALLGVVVLGVAAWQLFFTPAGPPPVDAASVPVLVPDDMPAVTRQPVTITGGEFDLEGELILPEGGRSQKPAVVFSPGSSTVHFHEYSPGFIASFVEGAFLPADVAVLLVNKRGVGESGGRWQQNDIEGRAEDVYASVQFLQAHPAIDASQVGVIGHSQGGWVAGLAAAEHPDVAFFITLAGPTTSVEEQIEQSSRNVFRCEGFEGDDLDRRVGRQLREVRFAESAGRVLPVGQFAFMNGILRYDPRDALTAVEAPGLLVFGGADPLVPPAENLARFDELFPAGPPENLTVAVMPAADHGFHVVREDCPGDTTLLPFSAELVETLRGWLAEQGIAQ